MRKKFYLAASVVTLLVCNGIASSQSSAAYAEGVTPSPSATKDSGTRMIRQISGTIVGIKRLSQRVWIITLDSGLNVLVDPATDGPVESLYLKFTRITVAYADQGSAGHTVVARRITVGPSVTPSPTLTSTATGCVVKISC